MAVIELAELLLSASVKINNSIKLTFAGAQVDWIIKTSLPLTLSLICTLISPSLNLFIYAGESGKDRYFATFFENSGLAVPAKTL